MAEEAAGHGALGDNLAALLDALEGFYGRIMPIVAAIQAATLRIVYTHRSQDHDIGPHRALEPVVTYLRTERDTGRIRSDLDLEAAALILISVAYHRALQRHTAPDTRLPDTAAVIHTLMPALTP